MPQPDLNSDDYYKILGCDRSTDDAQLKKAYRKLAVKWHPDKNPDNEIATKNFQKISEAYATLSDAKKRKLYDQYGVAGANAADQMPDNMPTGGGPGGFGGMPPGAGMGGGGGHGGGVHHMSPEEAQQFFSSFFGGSDPFGGMMGGMGGGGFNVKSSMGGVPQGGFRDSGFSNFSGGAGDPFQMMFNDLGPGARPMGGSTRGSMGNIGATQQQYEEAEERLDAISVGTVVSLKGLMNSPERNGDRGIIKQYIPSTGRYLVAIEDSDETMSVKPSNLLQHVKVRIHDIKAQPELNGKTGTIIAWNESKQRYNIYVMSLKKVVSLKAGNVVLDIGTVAQVTGLTSRPELNGKWGTITEWIRDSNKYEVQLSPQHAIRVKVEIMRV